MRQGQFILKDKCIYMLKKKKNTKIFILILFYCFLIIYLNLILDIEYCYMPNIAQFLNIADNCAYLNAFFLYEIYHYIL